MLMANCHNYDIICCREIKSKSCDSCLCCERERKRAHDQTEFHKRLSVSYPSSVGRCTCRSNTQAHTYHTKNGNKAMARFSLSSSVCCCSSLDFVRMQSINRVNRPHIPTHTHTHQKRKTMKKSCYMTDLSINLQREWTNLTRSRINNSPCIVDLLCVRSRMPHHHNHLKSLCELHFAILLQ